MLLAAFVASSLVGTLVTFDVQVLPQAVHRQLARSPGMSIAIIRLLRTVIRSEGLTALIATHDTELTDLADEVLSLEDGMLVNHI